MAEFTFKQLNKFIYDFTATYADLPADKIRKAFSRNGTPFNNIDDEALYFYIQNVDDASVNQTNSILTELDGAQIDGQKVDYLKEYWHPRRIRVNWTFYGDEDIVDTAVAFRGKLYSDAAVQALRAVDIGLINDLGNFDTLPELINNRWYWRCDLRVDLYYYHYDKEVVPALEAVDFALVPAPTQEETIEKVESGEIPELGEDGEGSDLYYDILLDIDELRKEAEKQKG